MSNLTNILRNANKNTVRYHFPLLRLAVFKKQYYLKYGNTYPLMHCWWENKLSGEKIPSGVQSEKNNQIFINKYTLSPTSSAFRVYYKGRILI